MGDSFSPEALKSRLHDEYKILGSDEVGFSEFTQDIIPGHLSLAHPIDIYAYTYVDLPIEPREYEEWYVHFIENNFDTLKELNVEEIQLFWDVYFEEHTQCNFEIFDRTLLKRIAKYDVDIPISIYNMSKQEMIEWLSEVGYAYDLVQEISSEIERREGPNLN
jgi:hypothetical protein